MQYFSIITLWRRKITREYAILKAVAKNSSSHEIFNMTYMCMLDVHTAKTDPVHGGGQLPQVIDSHARERA